MKHFLISEIRGLSRLPSGGIFAPRPSASGRHFVCAAHNGAGPRWACPIGAKGYRLEPATVQPRDPQRPDPDGLVPSGESGSRATRLAGEPLLATGQARRGALVLCCRVLACKPYAPV